MSRDLGNVRYLYSYSTGQLRPCSNHQEATAFVISEGITGKVMVVYEHGFSIVENTHQTDHMGKPNVPGHGVV